MKGINWRAHIKTLAIAYRVFGLVRSTPVEGSRRDCRTRALNRLKCLQLQDDDCVSGETNSSYNPLKILNVVRVVTAAPHANVVRFVQRAQTDVVRVVRNQRRLDITKS